MKLTKFKHTGVLPDGTFKNQLGAVYTEGRIVISNGEKGGCGLSKCHCSDGHWISVVEPRTKKGVVKGAKLQFANYTEMNEVLKSVDTTAITVEQLKKLSKTK